MSPGFEVYLATVEDAVTDINNVVTYKWLCLHLKTTANTAKRLLLEFVNRCKGIDKLEINYIVTGIRNNAIGYQVNSVRVGPFSQLETMRKEFSILTSVQVYSIQKVPSRTEDIRCAVGCDLSKAIDIKRTSAINCKEVACKPNITWNLEFCDRSELVLLKSDVETSLNWPCISSHKKMELKEPLKMFTSKDSTTEKLSLLVNASLEISSAFVLPDEKRESTLIVDESKNEQQSEDLLTPLKIITIENGQGGTRKQKLVEETVLFDEGYLSTKKRWLESSPCESNSYENFIASGTDVKCRIEEGPEFTVVKQNCHSIKNKQATLTSFFKRK